MSEIRKLADALDELIVLYQKMNEKGEPADEDAAAWKEDFQELWTGLRNVMERIS